jgi:hypothetical protein
VLQFSSANFSFTNILHLSNEIGLKYGSLPSTRESVRDPDLLETSRSEFASTVMALHVQQVAPIKKSGLGEGGTNFMIAKCANPACSTPLIYLREGKIFTMDHAGIHRSKAPLKSSGSVEHFWLCGPCAEHLTLAYQPGKGMSVVPKEPRARQATA